MTYLDLTKKQSHIENGQIAKNTWEDKLHTFLLSLVTAGTIGCFGFLWSLNNAITRLQDHDTDTIKYREDMSSKFNNIQLDIRDIRERMIRVEAKTRQ